MGKKVFISYKYADSNVAALNGNYQSTCRDYVNELQELLEESPHIFKAEDDDNDLSHFKDSTIASKLRDKIFDSSITVVLISKSMKTSEPEEDQWIPWEIGYSLQEHTRNGRTSSTNGLLAVVIPDENNSYEYLITNNPECNSRTIKKSILFNILQNNMFNAKTKETRECNGSKIQIGNPSYTQIVEWEKFVNNINWYLDKASELNDNIEDFTIVKEI